jgi:hypothetical protein
VRALHSFPWIVGLCISVLGVLSRVDGDEAGADAPRWSPAFERQVSRNVANLAVSAADEATATSEEKIIIWNPLSASLVSGCAGSACVGSGCGLSGCAGSGCGLSGCAGSGCLGVSVCGGSACVGSGCGLSWCVGSACGLSACVGSACTQSGCVGTLCMTSFCAGSGCIISACGESYCVASGCFGSKCLGSVACGGPCLKNAIAMAMIDDLRLVDKQLYEDTGGIGWWNEYYERNTPPVLPE